MGMATGMCQRKQGLQGEKMNLFSGTSDTCNKFLFLFLYG